MTENGREPKMLTLAEWMMRMDTLITAGQAYTSELLCDCLILLSVWTDRPIPDLVRDVAESSDELVVAEVKAALRGRLEQRGAR